MVSKKTMKRFPQAFCEVVGLTGKTIFKHLTRHEKVYLLPKCAASQQVSESEGLCCVKWRQASVSTAGKRCRKAPQESDRLARAHSEAKQGHTVRQMETDKFNFFRLPLCALAKLVSKLQNQAFWQSPKEQNVKIWKMLLKNSDLNQLSHCWMRCGSKLLKTTFTVN